MSHKDKLSKKINDLLNKIPEEYSFIHETKFADNSSTPEKEESELAKRIHLELESIPHFYIKKFGSKYSTTKKTK